MPSDAPLARGRASRRTILTSAAWLSAAAGAGLLSGCGIRVDGPHPRPQTTPPRTPVVDEAILLAAFGDATRLARDATALVPADDLTRRVAVLHRTQALVLRDVLRRAGVPDAVVSPPSPSLPPSASPSPSASASAAASSTISTTPSTPPTSAAPTTKAQLAAAEADALTAGGLDVLAGTTTPHRPTLTAISACRAAAATTLGSPVAWPASEALPSAGAVALLDATRAVAYGFEIIAARLPQTDRGTALATLEQVRRRESALVAAAGSAAPPEPLGYDLPFPVTTPDAARRLATTVLTGLVARGLDPLPTLPSGSGGIVTIVRLQAEAVMLGTAWGVAPTPFPGLAYP